MTLHITITSKPKKADSESLGSQVKKGLKKAIAASPIQVHITKVEAAKSQEPALTPEG